MQNKNDANFLVPGSDKETAPSSGESLPQNISEAYNDDSRKSYHEPIEGANKETPALLGCTLQVPCFTRATVTGVSGDRVTLDATMNGKPMRLHRRLEQVTAWLGIELRDEEELEKVRALAEYSKYDPAVMMELGSVGADYRPEADVITVQAAHDSKAWKTSRLTYRGLPVTDIEIDSSASELSYFVHVQDNGFERARWSEAEALLQITSEIPTFKLGDIVTVEEAYQYNLLAYYTLEYQFLAGADPVIKIEKDAAGMYPYLISLGGDHPIEWRELAKTDLFVTGILNGTDTLEIEVLDPIVIDEPAIDPDDTEIIPAPDVAEFDSLEGLQVGQPTPWVSGGMPDFEASALTDLEMLVGMRYMTRDGVTFAITSEDHLFTLTAQVDANGLNAFWQRWHGGIKQPLAEKQALEQEVERLTQRESGAREIIVGGMEIVDLLKEQIDDAHDYLDHQWIKRASEETPILSIAERIAAFDQRMTMLLDAERQRNATLTQENAALRQQLAQNALQAPQSVLDAPQVITGAAQNNDAFQADADHPRNAA